VLHAQWVNISRVLPIFTKLKSFCIGGHIRGRAYGNVFNFADASLMDQPLIVGGQVVIYNSHEDPANLSLTSMKVSMGFSHDVTATFQPVLESLIKRRPEIAGKS
jgi:hypothetical protein